MKKENVGPLLNEKGVSVTVDTDEAEVGAFFASLLNLTPVLLPVC